MVGKIKALTVSRNNLNQQLLWVTFYIKEDFLVIHRKLLKKSNFREKISRVLLFNIKESDRDHNAMLKMLNVSKYLPLNFIMLIFRRNVTLPLLKREAATGGAV